jgi:hypothetical protein
MKQKNAVTAMPGANAHKKDHPWVAKVGTLGNYFFFITLSASPPPK